VSAPAPAEAVGTGPDEAGTMRRVLQRVVLPEDGDLDVLPLYVDGELVLLQGTEAATGGAATTTSAPQHGDQVLGRRRYLVPAGTRSSFGTYFNAFPASYWRRWTDVSTVVLQVRTSGVGTVVVHRSNAKGNVQRVASAPVDDETSTASFELTLRPFVDGGWYWFDLVAGQGEVRLEEAWYEAEVAQGRTGTATVSITTMNRPDYCSRLLASLGADEGLRGVVDEVLVVDQGTQKVAADTECFPTASELLGDRLRVIDQSNLGGSGGFARGMLETLRAGRSDYVLLLDDDVVVEPEGILRAVTFADLARSTTIVGGHMFSMYERSLLHAYGESVQRWKFWWGPAPSTEHDHDLSQRNLRSTRWLHRRSDVDYNGWWMCLIPRSVIEQAGLALPLFIKWDDAEYGLRAQEHDVPTVSLPGVAVWHVPWTDKDDSVDWQAYFHARNRVVAALLHSPFERGGNVVRESLATQAKHLLSMQYSTAELRLLALEDALGGWQRLHDDLGVKLGEVRALRATYPDAQVHPDVAAYPAPRRRKPPRRNTEVEVPRGRLSALLLAAVGAVKQARPVEQLSEDHPQAIVPHQDARWWLLSQFDGVLVSTADGTGVAWYRRDPKRFADLVRRSVLVHERLLREWPRLAEDYRAGLAELASVERWEQTFRASGDL
jgi:galactofuranosylgalactofuranosylrhamnosyl-N-acetylglucosaminyl-diphospho-decaprenol beta-1,5/1,6-galactofuranosyltransferase